MVNPYVVALDGLLVFVAPKNPLKQLTLEQVAKVFRTNYGLGHLGQTPRKINVHARDDKARQDITRLAVFLKTPGMSNKDIRLAGFTESFGPFDGNRVISLNRANAVQRYPRCCGPGRQSREAYGQGLWGTLTRSL